MLPDGRVRFAARHHTQTQAGVKRPNVVGTDLTLAISLAAEEHGTGSGFDAPVDVALDSAGHYTLTWAQATFPVSGSFVETLPLGSPVPKVQDSSRQDTSTKGGMASGALDQGWSRGASACSR